MLKEEKVIKILCIIEIICSVIVVLIAKRELEFFFCGIIPMCFAICFMLNYKPVVGLMAFVTYALGSGFLFLPIDFERSPSPLTAMRLKEPISIS